MEDRFHFKVKKILVLRKKMNGLDQPRAGYYSPSLQSPSSWLCLILLFCSTWKNMIGHHHLFFSFILPWGLLYIVFQLFTFEDNIYNSKRLCVGLPKECLHRPGGKSSFNSTSETLGSAVICISNGQGLGFLEERLEI